MRALTIEEMESILQDATELDEEFDRMWILFTEDEQYPTFSQLFERDNFSHHDSFSDDWVEVDHRKIMKKILRGKDTVEIIKFALDFGRLVGRAEQALLSAS